MEGDVGRVAASDRPELSDLKQDRMTRIGFAYNQKPEVPALRLEDGAEDARPDEEPPSSADSDWAVDARAGAIAAAEVDDEFAEWDSAETINAVEQALSALGEVVRLEANADFPERLRASQPDIVYNIAALYRQAGLSESVYHQVNATAVGQLIDAATM